jgi:kinesin family protein 3/17
MIAMISPSQSAFSESLSTLYFAQRAKKIKNRPIINEDVNNRALIRKYENELKNLRNELELKNKMLNNNGLVMQLQEEKEQALQDKNEAIKELEKASRQYLIEREEKLKLEKKIQMMSEQMITGGHKIEETPQFQNALKNQLKLYENKILEIEKERQQLEEDKAENEEYREILLKQKDIMNSLTNKLNERDEYIAQLQEELESAEKNEQGLKNRVQLLENILTEKKIPILIDDYNYNNINLFKKNNSNNFSNSYLPYEAEINSKEYEGRPIIMLSSKEKIKELKSIISEQENKIHFLDLVSQKFINTMNQDGKVNINKLIKQIESSNELYQKINQLQKENNNLKNEINEQNNYINNINLTNINNKSDNIQLKEFKNDILNVLDDSIRGNNEPSCKNELIKIYDYISKNKYDNKNIISNIEKENNFNNFKINEKIAKNYLSEKIKNENEKIYISENYDNILNENKSLDNNFNKFNSIKGISYSNYVPKQNIIENEYNFKKININDNFISNNIDKTQYLTDKNKINNELRFKNKKYINKFINSNVNDNI